LNRGSTSLDKLYSSPGFQQYDFFGAIRTCYIEEVPESFTGIEKVDVVQTGRNYTGVPTLSVLGDGVGAKLEAVIVNRKFKSVRVLDPGSGYTTATILITGGNGTGAELNPVIQGRIGRLRSYYFDDSDIKTVLNDSLGTIEYDSGKITLSDFNPISINDPNGFLRLNVKPRTFDFKSDKQSLIVLDEFDFASILVNLRTSE
jgi:hypothetical protein